MDENPYRSPAIITDAHEVVHAVVSTAEPLSIEMESQLVLTPQMYDKAWAFVQRPRYWTAIAVLLAAVAISIVTIVQTQFGGIGETVILIFFGVPFWIIAIVELVIVRLRYRRLRRRPGNEPLEFKLGIARQGVQRTQGSEARFFAWSEFIGRHHVGVLMIVYHTSGLILVLPCDQLPEAIMSKLEQMLHMRSRWS